MTAETCDEVAPGEGGRDDGAPDDVIERCTAIYKTIVKPNSSVISGTAMTTVVARLHELDPRMLAILADRSSFTPGGAGVPNDVRKVIAAVHRRAYPNGSPFRNFGDAQVRKLHRSPRTRTLVKPTHKGRFLYARGWAVAGFDCERAK